MQASFVSARPTAAPAAIRGYDRAQLERDLRLAITEGQFEISWQPIVDCLSGALAGFEALLRWDRPGYGPVSPLVFVPLAESMGLHQQLDMWVLNHACAEAATWPTPLRLAVNISAGWMQSSDLSTTVETCLRTTKLDPGRLELEMTERVFIDTSGFAQSELAHLRAMGVSIALDDFGTGFSSLSYLRTIAFDKLKLDRVFVGALGTCRRTEVIVRSMMQLSNGLGMMVCAEGVERESQLGILQAYHCNEVQGYLIGRPGTINSDTFMTYGKLGESDMFLPV